MERIYLSIYFAMLILLAFSQKGSRVRCLNMLFGVIVQEIAAIILFFYSIKKFSKLIMRQNVRGMKKKFSALTKYKIGDFGLGIAAAAILQSNRAVSMIVLTLVGANVLNISEALPIIFGTPIGASSTAFLVSAKCDLIEEILIIAGAIILRTKHKNIGHSIFYLGLLLLSLELLGKSMSVLQHEEWFRQCFSFTSNKFLLFLEGIVLICLCQSGALIISVLTVLVSCEIMTMQNAIAMHIGTTVGSLMVILLSIFGMSAEAKKAARMNALLVSIMSFISLFFIGYFTQLGNYFENKAFGFALAGATARFIACMSAMIIFMIADNIIHKKKRVKSC